MSASWWTAEFLGDPDGTPKADRNCGGRFEIGR